jgi:hypothetical protein
VDRVWWHILPSQMSWSKPTGSAISVQALCTAHINSVLLVSVVVVVVHKCTGGLCSTTLTGDNAVLVLALQGIASWL